MKGIWDVKDIDSKCLCLPNDPQHPNPLPSNVLNIMNRRTATLFDVTSALSTAYQQSTPSWSISALLLPGKYVWTLLLGQENFSFGNKIAFMSKESDILYFSQVFKLNQNFKKRFARKKVQIETFCTFLNKFKRLVTICKKIQIFKNII